MDEKKMIKKEEPGFCNQNPGSLQFLLLFRLYRLHILLAKAFCIHRLCV